MRIGIFENLANNAYILTKLLRRAGYEAELILDAADNFGMSQPIWEDGDFEVETELLMNSKLSIEDWRKKADTLGWTKPEWIKYVERNTKTKRLLSMLKNLTSTINLIKNYNISSVLFISWYFPIIDKMKEYDVIITFGLGPVYAYFSGTPYIPIPFGGDITIIPFQDKDKSKLNRAKALLQQKAYKEAKSIIFGTQEYMDCFKNLKIGEEKCKFISFPVDTSKYCPLKNIKLSDLVDEKLANKADGKFLFFVPSRQDFYWKGSDKPLRAYARLVQKNKDVYMILTGWGNDIGKSKEMAVQLGIEDYLHFLPYALSKGRLLKFYNVADVVIDQFNLGSYGTSTLEAMSCQKPVIMYYDIEKYKPYFEEPAPILSARTEEEIFQQMVKIVGKREICEEIGEKSREWILNYHGKNNIEKIIRLCHEAIGQ
ncbi:MAG: glycosyltransferase [bacterium]